MYLITWYNFPWLNRSNGTRLPPFEWSVCCRGLSLPDNTQQSQHTAIRAPGGIQTPQSQRKKGCRPKPQTVWPLELPRVIAVIW